MRREILEAEDFCVVQWAEPTRRDALRVVPVYGGGEVVVCNLYGTWNNIDCYFVGADPSWVAPPGAGVLTLRLYAMAGGEPVLIQAATSPFALLLGAPFHNLWVLAARGRVSDGWRVTVEATGGAGVFGPGDIACFAWGLETGPEAVGAGPLPPVNVIFPPATSGLDLVGTIAAGPPAASVALPAAPAERYVLLSADAANTGIIFQSFASVANALASVQLGPGDAVSIEIDDASKVFVNGSVAGDKWRASVV